MSDSELLLAKEFFVFFTGLLFIWLIIFQIIKRISVDISGSRRLWTALLLSSHIMIIAFVLHPNTSHLWILFLISQLAIDFMIATD